MHKQSKSDRRGQNSKATGKQGASCTLQPIHSSDPVAHLRNQEILMVAIIHLLERLDKTLRARG